MALSDVQTKEFIKLVTDHQPELFAFIHSMVPSVADAEEILQDTHVFLWQQFSEYRPGSNFRAWAFRVAYHRILKFFKQQERQRKVFSEEFLTHLAEASITSPAGVNAHREALEGCLERLKPGDHSLLNARYRPGATVSRVADELGRNVDAVYRALRRIHQVLFECLQRKMVAEDEQ